ncbi:hypothetical protein [Vibrio tetraodonis]|uniref:hypothetical protein n=1 Tax=Vibrio tetraodonis TaxID=2231647 RepID=UPI0013B38B37|nr:hypothetical protein [Vibrio tetraodonis]
MNTSKSYQRRWSWLSKPSPRNPLGVRHSTQYLSEKIWYTKKAPRLIKAFVWRFVRQLSPEECEIWVKHYMLSQVLNSWYQGLNTNVPSYPKRTINKQWLARLFDIPVLSFDHSVETQLQNQLLKRSTINQKMIYCLRDFDATPEIIDTIYFRTTQHLPVEIKLIADQLLQRKSYYLSDRTKLSRKRCNEIVQYLLAVK